MNDKLSSTANLLGDPGRAAILLRLMGGLALPAGELAMTANVAPQTASEHLAKLVEGRFLDVERQGRHRYYRLASAEVADAIEALLVLTARSRVSDAAVASSRPQVGSLGQARTCYGHLPGWLGVQIAKNLEERGVIKPYNAKAYSVSPSGREWFEAIGVGVPSSAAAQKKLAVRCLDWTERRHHLAGTLGCAIYKRFREFGWLIPIRDTRVVRVTLEGRTQVWRLFRNCGRLAIFPVRAMLLLFVALYATVAKPVNTRRIHPAQRAQMFRRAGSNVRKPRKLIPHRS